MSFDLNFVKSQKGLKIVHLNVRSLIQNFDEVNATLLDGSLDVVVCSETWLQDRISDSLIANPAYNCTRLDRQTTRPSGVTKAGGGLCIFIEKDLIYDSCTEHFVSEDNLEMIHVVLRFETQKDISTYRRSVQTT